jgi:hypothetical protein
MLSRCSSESCGKVLRTKTEIIQLTTGRYVNGAITPFLKPEDTHNWHPKCFQEFPLNEQSAPYTCANCKRRVRHGELVIYACQGKKPDARYIRAESRGRALLYVAHVRCRGLRKLRT